MSSCAVLWCGKSSRFSCTRTDEVTFHRFPKDRTVREEWIKATRRGDFEPSNFSVICSRHFTEDSFQAKKQRRRLRETAVPTLNLPGISFESLINELELEETAKRAWRPPSAREPISIMLPTEVRDSPEPETDEQIDYQELYTEITSHNVQRLCQRICELKDRVDYKELNVRRLRDQVRYVKKQVTLLEKTIKDLDEKCIINEADADVINKTSTNTENENVINKFYDIKIENKNTKKGNRNRKRK